MRIDKYLKVSHIIKRRETAKKMLDAGYITIDGRVAKPATEINPGNIVTVTNPNGKSLTFKVKETREYCPLSRVDELYEIM